MFFIESDPVQRLTSTAYPTKIAYGRFGLKGILQLYMTSKGRCYQIRFIV